MDKTRPEARLESSDMDHMTDAELAIAAVDAGVGVIRGWAVRSAARYEKAGDDFAIRHMTIRRRRHRRGYSVAARERVGTDWWSFPVKRGE